MTEVCWGGECPGIWDRAGEQQAVTTSRKVSVTECCHMTDSVLSALHHHLLSSLQQPRQPESSPRAVTHRAVLCPLTLTCPQTRRGTSALVLHWETGDPRLALYPLALRPCRGHLSFLNPICLPHLSNEVWKDLLALPQRVERSKWLKAWKPLYRINSSIIHIEFAQLQRDCDEK